MKNLFFALEVEIHGAIRHAGFAGDICNFGAEISIAGKYANGRAQNCGTLIGDYWTIRIY
jgi:hypothetical protein